MNCLKIHKSEDPLVYPIILHEFFQGSKLIQGWVRFPGSKLCWHVWVEDPKLGKLDYHAQEYLEYVTELPENTPFDSDKEALTRWDKYNQSPKEFWDLQPWGIRSKLLASLKRSVSKGSFGDTTHK